MADESPRNSAGQGGPQSSPGGTAGGQAPRQAVAAGAGNATRRQLLKAAGGFAGVGVVGYAFHRTRGDIVAATDGSAFDDVPGRSEFVFRWTGRDLFTDERFLTALDRELQALAVADATSGPELFDTVENATGLDPRTAGEVTAFGRFPRDAGNYAGLLFESETGPTTVAEQIQQQGALTGTSEYGGQTLWGLGNDRLAWSLQLAHLEGSRYCLGSRPELEAVLDVRSGDMQRVGGRVRRGLDEAGGIVRGGFVVPPAPSQISTSRLPGLQRASSTARCRSSTGC